MDIILSDLTKPTPTEINLVLDDFAAPNAESVEADIFFRFEDSPTDEPQYLGTAAAGKSIAVPFDLTQGRAVRLFAVSRTAKGNLAANNVRAGVQTVFDPNLETATPVIGQLTPATNTAVDIWVNNFTTRARFRKVEVSPNSDMSSPDLVSTYPATDFPQSILPSAQTVTKTGVSGTVTKYIRVSHSSNGTTFGTASNILAVTFANSGGGGGTGGDGGPCFIGKTPIIADGDEFTFKFVFERKNYFKGRTVRSFDIDGNIVDAFIEDVFRHFVDEILFVFFRDGSYVHVTREHPFFTVGREFVPIGKLSVGDRVLRHRAGALEPVTITRIRSTRLAEPVAVYNLRSSNQHYLANRFAVHNSKEIEL